MKQTLRLPRRRGLVVGPVAGALLLATAPAHAQPARKPAPEKPAAGKPATPGKASPQPAAPHVATPEEAAEASAHLKKGVELFGNHKYEEAIAEFEIGRKLDPRPDFLFALAQAERLSGDCASAILYYREFLDSKPSDRQAEAAWANLDRCEHVLATSRAAQDAPPRDAAPTPESLPPGPAAPRPSAEPAAPQTRLIHHPWYSDVVGDGLAGGGLVAGAVGAIFLLRSSGERSDALDAGTYAEYASKMDDARTDRAIALSAFGVGGALVVGAVVRYVTHDRSERVQVAVQPGGAGVTVGVGGSF
jgi:tetratricopeptide (TPR) repeat protein